MNIAKTTHGSYCYECIDYSCLPQQTIITKEEQMKRLGMVKTFNKDDRYNVVLEDGSLYITPISHRIKFSFDTAESIVDELKKDGIKSESVRIVA